MAKKTVNPFLGLCLEPKEEDFLKAQLKAEDITGKRLIRRLVRNYLKSKGYENK